MKKLINHHEKFNKKKVYTIIFTSFLYGFALSVTSYIISFYFKEASGLDKIGVFYLLSYVIILFSLLNLHKLVKKIGKSNSLYLFLAAKIIGSLFIVILEPSIIGAFFLVFYLIFSNLGWVGIDIMLESFSVDKMSGRIRGLFLTIANTGFILGPFLSLKLLNNVGFRGVFLLVLIFDVIIFLIAISKLRGINHTYNRNMGIAGLLREVVGRKDILRIYHISYILDFFYGTMVIYSPLYLRSIGMSLNEIGIVFTFMLIPFIVIQYPVGYLADKKMGEKELIIFALFVIAFSTLSIFFIDSTSLIVWGGILFMTRIGAACLEILRDSYFYKRIDGSDVEIIDFFRTSKSVAYITVSILSSAMLYVLPLRSVFLLLTAAVFTGLISAFYLVDNKCEQEIKNKSI